MDTQKRYDDLFLAALSVGAGCTDVLSFLTLGELFTSAMTGNTALIAISIGRGDLFAASRSLSALIGFIFGVALATLLGAAWQAPRDTRHAVIRVLRFELAVLVVCAAIWAASGSRVHGVAGYTIILMSSFSMGIQAVCARAINVSGISTIIFTTGLVNIVTRVTTVLTGTTAWLPAPTNIPPVAETFAAYAGGALLAGMFALGYREVLIWVPVGAVMFAHGTMTRSLRGR